MRRAAVLVLIAITVLAPACTGKEVSAEQELARYLEATERSARTFKYTEETKDQTTVVEGEVEDDFRYRASMKINGTEVMTAVASDDSLALRVIDAAKVPSLVSGSQVVGDALRQGRWVIDPQAAPPVLAPVTRENSIEVGQNPIMDSIYIFQYVRRAIDDAFEVWEFNEDDFSYQAQDDPFRKVKPQEGVTRFDVRAPFLPRRSQRGTEAALPTVQNFRWMIFFVRNGKVFKIMEKIDFENNPEILRAKRGDGPRYPLTLLEGVRAGRTREPIRVRDMTYEVNPFNKEVNIALPTDNILSASLGGLFGPQGINAGGRRSGESDESGDSGGESGTTGGDSGPAPAPAPAEGGAPPAAPPAGAPPPGG